MKALLTRKIGMASIIDDEGVLVAVTLLSASPNVVTKLKTVESDGYQAVQLGFEAPKKLSKSVQGAFKKSGVSPVGTLKEIRLDTDSDIELGSELNVEIFSVGDTVDVTGTSKGKGFAGTIKRHNFGRGRKTHGKGSYRRPGSIGSMYPQKIFKGKKMAGQMGYETVTTRGLKIAVIDSEKAVLGVVGSVPGPRKGLVIVKGSK